MVEYPNPSRPIRKGLLTPRIECRGLRKPVWSIRPTDADTQIPLDISSASQIKFSLLSPWGYERLVVEEQIPPEELVKHLTRIYFQGITID